MVFSNWEKHEKDVAVRAKEISMKNVQGIVDRIESLAC
jgi:hypothetical protein